MAIANKQLKAAKTAATKAQHKAARTELHKKLPKTERGAP